MLENIRLSLKGIVSHKMRSFLTMLGIIIGIAAIIAIVSTIQGTNEQIKNNLVGSGTNTVKIRLTQDNSDMDFSYYAVPDGVPVFTQEVKDELLALDEVVNATFYRSREYSGTTYYLNKDLSSSTILGIDSDYFATAGYQVMRGRGFTQHDLTTQKKVAIVDDALVSGTFEGEDPIGKTIDLNGEPFTIIGVVKQKSQFQPVINSIDDWYTYSNTSSGTIYIPAQIWPVIYQYDEPYSVMVRAKSTDDMTSAGKKAEDILNSHLTVDNSEQTTAYKSEDLLSRAQDLQDLSASTNSMLIWIASISLLVGGIGVMNIMLVSVTERTREIGLKKALGARKRRILGQFLTEAAVLSSIGGLLGVIVGIILANIISFMASVPVAISIPAILVSVLFSMLVGILFGLLPSVRASNLNPIDALRYE